MAAVYPGAIPAKPTIVTADMSAATSHTVDRDLLWDELRAALIKLGTNPSGAGATVASQIATIRHRRHRNGQSLASGVTTAMFPVSSVGVTQENVGGITFTADATNGIFNVPSAGTYALTMKLDPSAALGATSAMVITIGGTAHQGATVGGSPFTTMTIVVYLAASSAVQFSVTNNSGGALTATIWECEITRLVGV